MKCSEKKAFESRDIAENRLKEIGVSYRIYKCSECGLYHFTKMTKQEHKFRTDKSYRNKVIQEKFIKRESEYWIKKLGIEED